VFEQRGEYIDLMCSSNEKTNARNFLRMLGSTQYVHKRKRPIMACKLLNMPVLTMVVSLVGGRQDCIVLMSMPSEAKAPRNLMRSSNEENERT
jgi:hypothetical protein